jgi:hypothetical protein
MLEQRLELWVEVKLTETRTFRRFARCKADALPLSHTPQFKRQREVIDENIDNNYIYIGDQIV